MKSIGQALLLCIILLTGTPAFADTITLASDYWCPYICNPAETGKFGISVDVVRKVFGDAGHSVRFVEVNWKRAIQETRHGEYNAIVDATKEDAQGFVFPSESINEQSSCLFAKPTSTWSYQDIQSLENISLGAIGGYHYTDALDDYIERKKNTRRVDVIHGENPLERNVMRVERGMIDVLVEDPYVMGWLLHSKSKYGPLKKVGCLPQKIPLFIAFSPEHPKSDEYARILSKGIRKLRKSGALQKIYKQYGVQ